MEPLLAWPAWPAARLSRTPGATGPARKVLRCLWAPLLRTWPVHVRPVSPGCPCCGCASVTCPFPLACGGQRQPPLPLFWVCLESIWGRALTAWLLRGSGLPPSFLAEPSDLCWPRSLLGLLPPISGKESESTFQTSFRRTVLWEGGQRLGLQEGPGPMPTRPGVLLIWPQPISSVP